MFNKLMIATLLLAGFAVTQAHAQNGQAEKQVKEKQAQEKVLQYFAQHAKPPMVKAAFMGVTGERVSEALNSQLKLPRGLGLVVTHVVPDGPAAEAGLQKHDVLHKFNDQLLVNFDQFAVLIRLHEPGDTVTLSVIRGGEPVTIDVTLTERQVPELPVGQPERPWMWTAPDAPAPFGTGTFIPPQIDTEKIQTDIFNALPKRYLKFDDENIIHAKDRYKLRIIDNEHKILINKLGDDAPDVTVEDAQGHILHEGRWEPGSDQTATLPADVIEKIERVLTAPDIGEPIRIHAEQIEITPAEDGDQTMYLRGEDVEIEATPPQDNP